MNCASIFAFYNGLVCLSNTFVFMSLRLHLKNNVGFCKVHLNAIFLKT